MPHPQARTARHRSGLLQVRTTAYVFVCSRRAASAYYVDEYGCGDSLCRFHAWASSILQLKITHSRCSRRSMFEPATKIANTTSLDTMYANVSDSGASDFLHWQDADACEMYV